MKTCLYQIEYVDINDEYECNQYYRVYAQSIDSAVECFRMNYSKSEYEIIEVSRIIDRDWRKY